MSKRKRLEKKLYVRTDQYIDNALLRGATWETKRRRLGFKNTIRRVWKLAWQTTGDEAAYAMSFDPPDCVNDCFDGKD